ncbi:hypothetical protein D3C71_1578620 [compost metagenome]
MRAADAVFNGQVLHGLHVDGQPVLLAKRFLQARHDRAQVAVAFGLRFQRNLHAPGAKRGVAAIDADERRHGLHVRVFQHEARRGLLAFGHGRKRDGLRALRNGLDQAGVLLREEALGHHQVQHHRECEGAQRHEQGQRLMPQHHLQHAVVAGDDAVDEVAGGGMKAAVLLFRFRAQQARAHHRRQGQ